jgi:hypothetical protein
MGFLRRLFGGSDTTEDASADDLGSGADPEADEREHEVTVLREEQQRMDDLARRQLRYADYAWTPPAEGGTRRADDGDAPDRAD